MNLQISMLYVCDTCVEGTTLQRGLHEVYTYLDALTHAETNHNFRCKFNLVGCIVHG